MIKKQVILGFMTYAVLSLSVAQAQSDDDTDGNLDLTMRLMPENAGSPEAVTRPIELPESAAAEARAAQERSNQGLVTANAARGNENRAEGLAIAEQARAEGSEFGQAARELAQENRENAGRGERPEMPVTPPTPPDVGIPGQPNPPGPPSN